MRRASALVGAALIRAALTGSAVWSCDAAAPPPAHVTPSPAPRFVAPFPARARGAAAVEQNQRCVSCHPREAEDWQGSLHQRANIEPAYVRSFAIEPMPFCRSCHAPEADPFEAPAAEISELGVACVTCHVTSDDDAVLAAPAGGDGTTSPHALLRDARFEGSDACAGCHEFRFPTRRGDAAADFMQTTVREHAASGHAERTCAECHMPADAEGRRSHAFVSSRDPELLRRAVKATARRDGPTTVTIDLALVGVGHAFPTGDLFRRVEVLVEAFGDDHLVLASDRAYLARHFELTARGRSLVRDDRLIGEGRAFTFDLGPDARSAPIAWRVAYQRVAHPMGSDDQAAVLEGEVVLDEGVIASPGAP